MTTNLVFLDTEFTNLDPRLGDVIEAAWAVGDGPVKSTVFNHTLQHASKEALEVNRYYERGFDRYCTDSGLQTSTHPAPVDKVRQLGRDITGATVVAENYGIDVAVLARKIGYEPWHYRKVELSSVALIVFDLDRPEGLVKTAGRLRDLGYEIPENNHTAAADVECLRACYNALRAERNREY